MVDKENKTMTGILENLKSMTMLEINDLVSAIETEFGVSADACFSGGGANVAQNATEEKTSFDIFLTSVGDNKIGVIKVVREISGLGLMEAKKVVESAPVLIKDGLDKAAVEEMKAKFSEVGATVEAK